MADFKTHYDNLQVSANASSEVIRAAYRSLAQKYHPDKFDGPESERIMKILNVAYDTLMDPAKRREHDAWIQQMNEAKQTKVKWESAGQGGSSSGSREPMQPGAMKSGIGARAGSAQPNAHKIKAAAFFYFTVFLLLGYSALGLWGAIAAAFAYFFRRLLINAIIKIFPAAVGVVIGLLIIANLAQKLIGLDHPPVNSVAPASPGASDTSWEATRASRQAPPTNIQTTSEPRPKAGGYFEGNTIGEAKFNEKDRQSCLKVVPAEYQARCFE